MSDPTLAVGCGAWREHEHVGTYVSAKHDDELHAEIDTLRSLLDEAMRRVWCKCGWENLGKEGYCGQDVLEHGSCEFSVSVLLALKEAEP